MLRFLAALLGFSFGLWPTIADACSCGPGEEIRYPSGPRQLPLNIRAWTFNPKSDLFPHQGGSALGCPSPTPPFPWLRINEEHEVIDHVAYHTTQISDELWVSIPDQLLQAGGLYDLSDPDAGPVRVSDHVDHTPPTIESITVADIFIGSGASAACQDSFYAEIDVQTDGDIVVVDVEGDSDFDPVTFCGRVSLAVEGSGSIIVGRKQCGASSWSRARRGDELKFRVGSLDLAGNFSGWSEEQSVTLSNCACRAGGNPSGEMAWMLFGFWGLRAVRVRKGSRWGGTTKH